MRSLQIVGSLVLVLAACARPEPAPPAEEPASPAAAFAGTWQVRGYNEAGDSIVAYQVTATADTAGWVTVLPGREPVPTRVVLMDGDSVVTEAGPFESVLRPGVQVSTRSVMRLQGDALVGTTTARYSTAGADSVATIRLQGTRQQ